MLERVSLRRYLDESACFVLLIIQFHRLGELWKRWVYAGSCYRRARASSYVRWRRPFCWLHPKVTWGIMHQEPWSLVLFLESTGESILGSTLMALSKPNHCCSSHLWASSQMKFLFSKSLAMEIKLHVTERWKTYKNEPRPQSCWRSLPLYFPHFFSSRSPTSLPYWMISMRRAFPKFPMNSMKKPRPANHSVTW